MGIRAKYNSISKECQYQCIPIYIFAWVPHLESGSEASEILFSSYRGIAAVGGAIALMWLEISSAIPDSLASERNSSLICRIPTGSSPLTGSSSTRQKFLTAGK